MLTISLRYCVVTFSPDRASRGAKSLPRLLAKLSHPSAGAQSGVSHTARADSTIDRTAIPMKTILSISIV